MIVASPESFRGWETCQQWIRPAGRGVIDSPAFVSRPVV